MENLVIRKATIKDSDKLKDLRTELLEGYPGAYAVTKQKTEEEWKDQFSDKNKTIFVADLNGEIVGVMGLTYRDKPKTSPYISGMGVLPEFKSRGIGSKLIQEGFKLLSKNGDTSVYLDVIADQEKSIDFYKKHDFKIIEELKGGIQRHDGTWQDVYIMKKDFTSNREK